jgi:putative oxidoreductase
MPPSRASAALGVALWTVQGLLFVAFGFAGFTKATSPVDLLASTIPWTQDVPLPLVRFIGLSELAGAVGLVIPALTRIKPGLTPLAALGLATVMLFAALFHLARGEAGSVPVNVALGGLAGLVAWGRLRKAPIPPRS